METLGILDEIEVLVSDKLQVVLLLLFNPLSFTGFCCCNLGSVLVNLEN
jgi:hypothetical protein